MLFRAVADLVLAFHIALFVVLGTGVILAALGLMRHHQRLNLLFWPALTVSLGWAMIPVDCGLTDIESWLRQRVEPDWTRPLGLPETVTNWLIGVVLPRQFYLALGGLMSGLAIFGFWRCYGKGRISSPPPPLEP